jgi:hypothetical protein
VVLVLGSGYILVRSGLTGEVPTMRYIHKSVAFAENYASATLLWFLWFGALFIGIMWLLVKLAQRKERNGG